MEMETHVQQWGNSLAVRLPKALAKIARLRAGSRVSIASKHLNLVITPQASVQHKTLKQLLKGVTAKNCHAEVDWGPPVGKEIW